MGDRKLATVNLWPDEYDWLTEKRDGITGTIQGLISDEQKREQKGTIKYKNKTKVDTDETDNSNINN